MRFLFDGDVYVYHAAHVASREVQFDRTLTRIVDVDELHKRLESQITAHAKKVHKALGLKKKAEIIVALSGVRADNWRRKVLDSYKGNRRPDTRPIGFEAALEFVRKRFPVEEVRVLEADDVLGIRATEVEDAVIFTTDKDMLSIPRMVARPHDLLPSSTSSDVELIRVNPVQARVWHMKQTLTGDAVDNYAGLRGIGDKTADKILNGLTKPEELWAAVVAAYESKGQTEDDALVQARVARILQAGEYDFKTEEVTLWTPK